ncbi:hypothetical protein HKX48_002894 [Thoreauomyces humboldtii]|nr:hypothetical protein HKX48_002894 [Thoreauomyces humboldtii]
MAFMLEHPWVPEVVRETFGINHHETSYERSSAPWSASERVFTLPPYACTNRFTTSGDNKVFSATWSLAVSPTSTTAATQSSPSSKPLADVISIHGLHDYGTRWADVSWPSRLVNAGYRLTMPDLIGHGRSSGVHGGFSSIDEQVQLVHDVLVEVVRKYEPSRSGKVFLMGGSLGGLLALAYARRHPEDMAGLVVLCPLVSVQDDSRPGWAVQMVAHALCYVAPFLPLAAANRGKNASDIRFEEMFLADPLTYHGRLRIGTGLAMLNGFEDLQANLTDIKTPFIVIHGDADRATNPEGSKDLYARALSTDKTLHILEGQEHDLSREPKAEEVCDLFLEWLGQRAV